MRAEDFFPLGWLDRQFRRQPYPDMTYERALDTAATVLWNMDSPEADRIADRLRGMLVHLATEHLDFPGRSRQHVAELNELWRGKVTTLLKWFTTSGGTK